MIRDNPSSQFSAVSHSVYLAHCAISPMPECVRSAISTSLAHFQQHGVYNYQAIAAQMGVLKSKLGSLFGGKPEHYACIPNTSFGINQVAHGIPWQPNDTIVLFDGEFPTNIRPWLHAAKCYDLNVCTLPQSLDPSTSDLDLTRFEETLRAGARLVAVSAVQFQTGRRMPIQRMQNLCKQYGALLFVDAIQACGALPYDGSNIDFWVSGGHKWMLGPEGTGFLYIHPEVRPQMTPRFQGWLSLKNPLNFLFDGPGLLDYERPLSEDAAAFELGTHNRIGCAGLLAATTLIESVTPSVTFDHVQSYHDLIEPLFKTKGFESVRASSPENRSNILSFLLPKSYTCAATVSHFASHGIVLTAPDGHLRIAPHYWNPLTEVAVIEDALSSLTHNT